MSVETTTFEAFKDNWIMIQLPEGSLIIARDQSHLTNAIIESKAWVHTNSSIDLAKTSRRPYLNHVEGFEHGIVIKPRRRIEEDKTRLQNLLARGKDSLKGTLVHYRNAFRYLLTTLYATQSILNEIELNRRVAQAYCKQYGEPLPIEKPIGAFIDRTTGAKYTFYGFIEATIIDRDDVLFNDEYAKYKHIYKDWERMMKQRLLDLDLNIDYHDFHGVIVIDPSGSYSFVVMDTEGWKREAPFLENPTT